MQLTAQLKAELAGRRIASITLRRAQMSALLRLGGGIHLIARSILVESEVDSLAVVNYLVAELRDLYGVECQVIRVRASGTHQVDRYVVRVVKSADKLARQVGLLDKYGLPFSGLVTNIVTGGLESALGIVRGAIMARGTLTASGRSVGLEIQCPNQEVAMSLCGAFKRLGVTPKTRKVRESERVYIRDNEQVEGLLAKLGARESLKQFAVICAEKRARAEANRMVNCDEANLRRSSHAAVNTAQKVSCAFEILGDWVPEGLEQIGRLRLEHRDASLEELGQLADPPVSKDTVSGRLRRLISLANRQARSKGEPEIEERLGLRA